MTIGVVGTGAVLYFPETVRSLVSSVLLAATGSDENGEVDKMSHYGDDPDAANRQRIIYEERNRLERRIKNLDRIIYVALGNMDVPEDDVNILEVDHKSGDHQEWDHALIEVTLPKGLESNKVLEGLKKALAESDTASKPGITVKKKKSTLLAEIRIDGLHTHTLWFSNAGENRRVAEKPKKGIQPKPVTSSANSKAAKPKEPNREHPVQTARLDPTPSVGKPKVAIVIDDFGLNTDQARCFLELDLPITFSVLPFLPHSIEVANMAHDEGREVMLHMPMQPTGSENPGKGVLLVSMDRENGRSQSQGCLAGGAPCRWNE